MKHILVAIALCALSVNALADDGTPIRGAGSATCGAWTEARKNDVLAEGAMISWMLGFVSGFNEFLYQVESVKGQGQHKNGIYGDTDTAGLKGYLDKYCREYPLTTLYEASQDFIIEMMAKLHPDIDLE